MQREKDQGLTGHGPLQFEDCGSASHLYRQQGLQQLQVLGMHRVCRGEVVLDYSHCKWDALDGTLQHHPWVHQEKNCFPYTDDALNCSL